MKRKEGGGIKMWRKEVHKERVSEKVQLAQQRRFRHLEMHPSRLLPDSLHKPTHMSKIKV